MSVSGASRYRYFEKPLVQTLHSFKPILTDPTESDHRIIKTLVNEPFSRTTSTQTQYRESETQTEPYSPPINVSTATTPDIAEPEILSLQHLTCANGQLPVGSKEIAWICRNRERRLKAKLLPSISDEKTLKLHKAFLEEQEQFEFQARERELEEQLEARLRDFKQNLYCKYEESERNAEEKIDALRREAATRSVRGAPKRIQAPCTYKKVQPSTANESNGAINSKSVVSFSSILQSTSNSIFPSSSQQWGAVPPDTTTLMEEHRKRSANRNEIELKKDLEMFLKRISNENDAQ